MRIGIRLKRKKKKKKSGVLDEISNVHWHFLHGCIVEGLDVSECTLVIFSDHVDSDTLSAKTATTSNSIQIKHLLHNSQNYTNQTKSTERA